MDDTLDNTTYEPDLSGQDILPELSQAGITTAYQIQAFSHVDHPHTAFLSSTHLSLSEGIVCLYHKPDGYRCPSPEASSANARTRSRSKGLRSLGYPSDWVLDRKSLTTDLKRFLQQVAFLEDCDVYRQWRTEHFRDHRQDIDTSASKGKVIMDPARSEPRQDRLSGNSAIPTDKGPISSHHTDKRPISFHCQERPMRPPKPTSSSPTPEQNFRSSISDEWDEAKARKNLERDLSSEQLRQVKSLLVAARKQGVNEERMASGDIMSSRRTGHNTHHDLSSSPDNIHSRPARRELSLSPIQQRRDSRPYNRDLFYKQASLEGRSRQRLDYRDLSPTKRTRSRSRSLHKDDTRFNPEELGFFDPQLETNEKLMEGDIVNVGSKTYYRNVHMFVDAFKDLEQCKSSGLVRRNLNKCLRGVAQEWYIGQLTDMEREYIKEGHGVDRWKRMLLRRFKKTQSSALKALEAESYSLSDIRSGRHTSSYVTTVIRAARDAGLEEVSAQLTWAWNKIDPDLRGFIRRPTSTTTVTEFVEELDNMKEVWEDKYARKKTDNYQRPYVPSRRGQSNFSSPRIYSDPHYYASSKQPPIPRQANSRYDYSSANTLPPRPILQLTNANDRNRQPRPMENRSSIQEPQVVDNQKHATSYRYFPSRTNNQKDLSRGNFPDPSSYQDRPRDARSLYQDRPQDARQKKSQGVYQVDEDENQGQDYDEESSSRGSELLEEEEVGESEVRYEDTKANHGEVPVSFEAKCRRCYSIFPSRNKLHQHLRLANCRVHSVVYKTDSHIAKPSLTMILSTAPTENNPGLGF